jgi:uncharacterized protein YbcV (DUF1398 family)
MYHFLLQNTLLKTHKNSDKTNSMSKALDKLQAAQKQAMANRPKVGGFPYVAETLRLAGVKQNIWTLPACQSIYHMENGSIVQQGTPLVNGSADIPAFDKDALNKALRTDQVGKSTFPEFLQASWKAGVIWYQVDFEKRTVTYGGSKGETYIEEYPSVSI